MDVRVNVIAVVVAIACVGVVASRVSSAPHTEAGPVATKEQRAMFAASIGGNEATWRRQAEQDFPSDLWSQRDAFHGHEAQSVRDLAGGTHVPFEEVIRAIDEDVRHTRGIERSARAIPCKPRPFYD
jgi:hypothetical protein